ncbi:hypothetical protein GDO86_013672 [Hymenochirus boettgeri]|uniref:UDENN domain-containing protein n=1 Tax=Hymenochirus boettgeri TaxID=247094 RepID=A0A8T2ISB5_9PIPI|nr:hypothetical protein GDO86_013672 [Hymenochirus boettgeri]
MSVPEVHLILSIGLIEKDRNGDALWVWCYPSVTAELREILLRKCPLHQERPPPHSFLYGQHNRVWFYIAANQVEEVPVLDKITHFCVVLTAKDFNPEKYAALSRILSRIYMKQGSPVPMMESYLSVLTKGACSNEENGTFLCRDYDQRRAFLSSSVKEVVSQFGMETIILYTALMLKKRIVVFHPKLEALQEFTRALPAFVWHRQDWSIVHPYVHLIQVETITLQNCTGYVAGFTDPDVSNRLDLYDVYVNLAERNITVSQNAKEALALGKLHKDIGQMIVQLAEDPETSDNQIIKDINGKTREILSTLSSFAESSKEGEKPSINVELLRQKKFAPVTEQFLFQLAAAEQMLQT